MKTPDIQLADEQAKTAALLAALEGLAPIFRGANVKEWEAAKAAIRAAKGESA